MRRMKRWIATALSGIILFSTGSIGFRAEAIMIEPYTEFSRTVAGEGMVLLKNDIPEGMDTKALPFVKGEKIALYGGKKSAEDYQAGGGGSGVVRTPYKASMLDGMELKEREGKVVLDDEQRINYWTGTQPTQEQIARAAETSDTAIAFISRYSEEGRDRPLEGDYYLTAEEKERLQTLRQHFKKLVVVLNIGAVMDTSWFMGDDPECPAFWAGMPLPTFCAGTSIPPANWWIPLRRITPIICPTATLKTRRLQLMKKISL